AVGGQQQGDVVVLIWVGHDENNVYVGIETAQLLRREILRRGKAYAVCCGLKRRLAEQGCAAPVGIGGSTADVAPVVAILLRERQRYACCRASQGGIENVCRESHKL